MQPANEICDLFVPLIIVVFLGGIVFCQFWFNGKEF